jgi:hypothetical protein
MHDGQLVTKGEDSRCREARDRSWSDTNRTDVDWTTGTYDHRPGPRAELPRLPLLEPAWHATSPSGKVPTCALYRRFEGRVDVRAEYQNSDLIRAELVRDVVTARQIAAGFKDAAMAKGFAEL